MALFKTTPELKPFYPVGANMEFEDLKGALDEVEQEFLVEKILGPEQYNELHLAYQAGSMTPEQAALLIRCQPAMARLALHRFTPEVNVSFNSGGLTVGSTPTSLPASEWRTRDVERRLLQSGYRALDVLIGFLNARQVDYVYWGISAQYVAINSGIMRRTAEFDVRVGIGNSHWFYLSLLPMIRRIENGPVAETLCSPNIFSEVSWQLIDTVVGEWAVIRELCMNAIAHLAFADAIVELGVGRDDRGFFTFASLTNRESSIGVVPASGTQRDALIAHHKKIGNAALAKLKQELYARAFSGAITAWQSTPCFAKMQEQGENPTTPRTDGTAYHAM